MEFPTPSTSHIPSTAFESLGIYEPAEDTFLILETLSSSRETESLHSRFSTGTTPLVLEVGTGSGIIIAFLTAHARQIFGRDDVLTMAVDVTANAVREGRRTVEAAVREKLSATDSESGGVSGTGGKAATGLFMDMVLSDLATVIRKGSVDVLVFNPPYVPTETLPEIPLREEETWMDKPQFERESQLLALAYAGGEDGMQTTERLLRQLDRVLSERGVAYVLFCKRNRPYDLMRRLREGEYGFKWKVEVVGESGGKGGWERLVVLRIWRDEGNAG